MFFTLFKLPRTGSTRIVKYLDRAPETRCIHEILQKFEGDDYSAEIKRRLGPASLNHKCLGFSLNPLKHFIKSSTFFDPQPYIRAHGKGLVISLIREDVFQQAVSYWLSKRLQMWPGDADAAMASQLKSYIGQGGIEIPPVKLKQMCRRFTKQNSSLVAFSAEFANHHGLEHLQITYEGVYNFPNPDLQNLENTLGITLDSDLVLPSKKVLPMPEEWIANFDALSHTFAPNDR